MKTRIIILMAVLLIVVSALGTACSLGTISTPESPDTSTLLAALSRNQQTGIWVTGEGKVKADPDVAVIQVGVEVESATVAEAQNKAAAAMDKIKASLISNGVAEKDIKTSSFNIQPIYQWNEKGQRGEIIAYKVTNMVTTKIRQVGKAGLIVDAVAQAGGDFTRIQGISFTIDDPAPYFKQAREKAVKDAIEKAEQIASLAEIELGKLIYVSEGGGYIPRDIQYSLKAEAGAPAPTTPISPGELEITMTVQMVYSID